MRLYGEANNVRGLATGPIETRFARLRQTVAADTLIVWTTPSRWAAGEGLSLRFPQLHLEFVCALGDGHLVATKVSQVPEDARPPDREPGAVGVVVRAERIPLPPEDADSVEPDPGVDVLEQHFARLAGRRWGGFAAPLRAALEAEALEDEARTQRLTVPFKDAAMTRGGEEDHWRLKGVPAEALRALDDGEWLEVLDEQSRSRTSARVIDTHPSAGSLIVGVRASSDPPRSGFVRPRSRRKILEQKRALLEELASPTGSLPNLVRLVAAPASMPAPRQVRPVHFVNPAVVRNRSQARAVSLALGLEEGQALLIQGPPGTGKSTTAAEIDVQLILRDPGVRILVCSHSNHGTDNMLMKVLPFLEDADERIARIGFYERIAPQARPYYAAPDADLGDRNIIFTTIDALVLQDIAGARVYDYVLLDEANRAGVLDSLLALARGKRMILVGDPMQLQPVMSEAEQQMVAASNGRAGHARRGGRAQMVGVAQPGAQNVIGKSLFAWIQERRFAPPSTVLLDQQNRMHPAIGELVSRVFYASRVRTGPAAPRRGTGLPMFPSPVTWVDTRSLRGNVESRAGGTSLFNVAEARLVTSVTRHLAAQAPPNLTIGVITAYAEQRDLLRRMMGPHDWPPERQLEIDTVDAFEGREKDIIVLSLVRANRRRDIGFLRLEQRLNVAVSRSRRLIIIVGDTSTLRQGYFHHLVATAQSVGHILPAPKLIGQMLHRGRRLRERDDRRREGDDRVREGVAEELVASGAAPGVVDGTSAPVDGEAAADGRVPGVTRRDRGFRRDRRRRSADEAAVVGDQEARGLVGDREPVVGADQERGAGAGAERGFDAGEERDAAAGEGGSPTGARRRRRRAWERRRERLRMLGEEQRREQEGVVFEPGPESSEVPSDGGVFEPGPESSELPAQGVVFEPGPESSEVPAEAPRREFAPMPAAADATSLSTAPQSEAATSTPRRRRRRLQEAASSEETPLQPEFPEPAALADRPAPAAADRFEPSATDRFEPGAAPEPRQRRRRRPELAPEPTAEDRFELATDRPELSAAPEPRQRRGRRRPELAPEPATAPAPAAETTVEAPQPVQADLEPRSEAAPPTRRVRRERLAPDTATAEPAAPAGQLPVAPTEAAAGGTTTAPESPATRLSRRGRARAAPPSAGPESAAASSEPPPAARQPSPLPGTAAAPEPRTAAEPSTLQTAETAAAPEKITLATQEAEPSAMQAAETPAARASLPPEPTPSRRPGRRRAPVAPQVGSHEIEAGNSEALAPAVSLNVEPGDAAAAGAAGVPQQETVQAEPPISARRRRDSAVAPRTIATRGHPTTSSSSVEPAADVPATDAAAAPAPDRATLAVEPGIDAESGRRGRGRRQAAAAAESDHQAIGADAEPASGGPPTPVAPEPSVRRGTTRQRSKLAAPAVPSPPENIERATAADAAERASAVDAQTPAPRPRQPRALRLAKAQPEGSIANAPGAPASPEEPARASNGMVPAPEPANASRPDAAQPLPATSRARRTRSRASDQEPAS